MAPCSRPATATGTLTISNELDLSDQTVLQFGLGTNSDKVVVSGNLTLGGLLNITNAGGFGVGTYTLFTYGGALTMGGLAVASAPAGFDLHHQHQHRRANQPHRSTAAPLRSLETSSSTGRQFCFDRNGRLIQWNLSIVLASTNLGLPLSNWTRLLTNQFDGSGNFNFTNAPGTNAPQSFYLLQLP